VNKNTSPSHWIHVCQGSSPTKQSVEQLVDKAGLSADISYLIIYHHYTQIDNLQWQYCALHNMHHTVNIRHYFNTINFPINTELRAYFATSGTACIKL